MAEAAATISAEPVYVDPSLILYPVERKPETQTSPTFPSPVVSTGEAGSFLLNIETTGLNPWEHRIISIGILDMNHPEENPVVIMNEDEKALVETVLIAVKYGQFRRMIGYGLSFDFRFILIKAMKYNLDCREFYELQLYDLMQAAAQGKFEYVYYAQKPPSLSILAAYIWGFPKAIDDKEMIQAYLEGDLDTVYNFTFNQMMRILSLYILFTRITESSVRLPDFGSEALSLNTNPQQVKSNQTKLTIQSGEPENLVKLKCPSCLSEKYFEQGTTRAECTICGGVMKPI